MAMFDRIIGEAVAAANIADEAFDAAIKKAGFKSRWDWFYRGGPASLVDAYNEKVLADRNVHHALEASRVRPQMKERRRGNTERTKPQGGRDEVLRLSRF